MKSKLSTQSERSNLGIIIPPNYYVHQKASFRYRLKVYNFLHSAQGFGAITYHLLFFMLVITCLVINVFSTLQEFEVIGWQIFIYIQSFIVLWITIELMVRVWSASCHKKYEGWRGKLYYLSSVLRIIDLSVIVVSVVVIWLDSQSAHWVFAATAAMHIIRL